MTRDEALSIIDRLCNGETLRAATSHLGGSQRRAFLALLESDPALAKMYAQSQTLRAELLADDIVDIADNEPDPGRARVRVDARRWFAGCIRPQKYGARVDVNVQGDVNLRTALDAAISRATLPLPSAAQHAAIPHAEPIAALEASDCQSPDTIAKPDGERS